MHETARPHLLQSTGWAEVKAATGWRAERYVFEEGDAHIGCVQVLRKRLVRGLDVAYAPRGPLVDDEKLPDAIVALRKALSRGLTVSLLCDRAWELFGGWSGAHSEKRPFYLLKWHSLMQMKELGVRRYDMWGLAEGDELAGVENFKLGFGGEITPWIGALETPVTAFLFPLWRFGARRRLAAASA